MPAGRDNRASVLMQNGPQTYVGRTADSSSIQIQHVMVLDERHITGTTICESSTPRKALSTNHQLISNQGRWLMACPVSHGEGGGGGPPAADRKYGMQQPYGSGSVAHLANTCSSKHGTTTECCWWGGGLRTWEGPAAASKAHQHDVQPGLNPRRSGYVWQEAWTPVQGRRPPSRLPWQTLGCTSPSPLTKRASKPVCILLMAGVRGRGRGAPPTGHLPVASYYATYTAARTACCAVYV